jgi:DNA-binding CsgD family transcriptional regulator/PAS domain-containing protein
MVSIYDLSRLLFAIYAAVTDPGEWGVALDEIASALGATGCGIMITHPKRNEIMAKSVGTDPASMEAYNEYFGRLDPSPSALAQVPVGEVVVRQQLVSPDVVAHSEFYNDWAHPNSLGDGVFSVLTRDGDSTSWICVAAKARLDPFGTPSRIRLLQTLVPHLQQAIQVQIRLSELDRRRGDFEAAIDVLADGIVIVGSDARVIHMNSAAAAILASGDGLCVRSGRLEASDVRIDGVMGRAVRSALPAERIGIAAGGCVAVPRPSKKRPYVLRVVPLTGSAWIDGATPTALVVIADPERKPVPGVETLRRLYGLTKTEAEVASRVLDGTGLGPIAEALALSLSTVRTHLRHVFEKTDTHHQAELLRLLLSGLTATRHLEIQEER